MLSCHLVFLLLCFLGFVAKCILELVNIFAFFLFSFLLPLSCFLFSGSILTDKSQKVFQLSLKIFCKRKLSCTCLDLREIFLLRELLAELAI